jgi:hypothetical protein
MRVIIANSRRLQNVLTMRKISKTLLISIIILIGLLFVNKQVGYFDIPFFNVPKDSVRIKFINDSDKTISAIKINGQTIKTIKVGDYFIYTYKHSGEGTYQFEIEFETGKKLKEKQRYVEAGYYLTERINNNSVDTEY